MSQSGSTFLLSFYRGEELLAGAVELEDRLTLGRSSDNGIVLSDPSISRHHATFALRRGRDGEIQVMLRDEGSTNGCVVNGRKLKGDETPVQPGDQLQFGPFRAELVSESTVEIGADDDWLNDPEATISFEDPLSSHGTLPAERLEALYEFASDISALEGEEETFQALGRLLASCLRFDLACVLLHCEQGLRPAFSVSGDGSSPVPGPALSRTMVTRCFRDGVAVLVDRRSAGTAEDSTILKDLTALMAAPLRSKNERLGVAYLSTTAPDVAYGKEDLQLLIVAAGHVASHVSSVRAFRKLGEEKRKLQAVLANLREGVLVADENLRVIDANPAARGIFGAGVAGKRVEEALEGFHHSFPVQALPALSTFEMTEKTGRPAAAGPEGLPPAARVFSATLSRNEGGDPGDWKYVICLRDVSQVKRMERMKSVVVSRLAHKLISPITMVSGAMELVDTESAGKLGEELREMLAGSQARLAQCVTDVRRFLQYAEMDLGRITAERVTDCPLAELLDAAEAANAERIREKDFKVIRLFSGQPVCVHGVPEKLKLAFQHLVENTVKFGRRGGTLLVRAETGGLTVKVSLHDDGPGIPPAQIEYVGQLLHQVDLDNTGEVPGVGLGLWVVNEIVRAHGGSVTVRSPVAEGGEGTLVELVLPGAVRTSCRAAPLGGDLADEPDEGLSTLRVSAVAFGGGAPEGSESSPER